MLQVLLNTFTCRYQSYIGYLALVKLRPYYQHEQEVINSSSTCPDLPAHVTHIINNQARDKVVSQTLINHHYYNKLKTVREDRWKNASMPPALKRI